MAYVSGRREKRDDNEARSEIFRITYTCGFYYLLYLKGSCFSHQQTPEDGKYDRAGALAEISNLRYW